MKKRNLAIIALFVFAAAAIVLLPDSGGKTTAGMPGSPGAAGPGKTSGQSGQAETAVLSVKTASVTRMTLQDYIEVNGDVVVDATVEVRPQVAGVVRSVKVALGSEVAEGQLVAEIDPSTPGSAYAINSVLAPIAGTVTSSPLPVGSTVSTSSAIVELGDVSAVELEAKIPERYVGVLKTGLKASATFKAYPGELFSATVTRVSPVIDASSRTKTVRLKLDKPDPRVDAGMFATIKLNTVEYANRLIVAESSVVSDSTGSYVFVVNSDGTASKRSISIGASVDGKIEAASGVDEGDLVVVEGASLLTDGARVKDITDRSAENGGSK